MKSNPTAPTNSGEPAASWLKKYSVPIATYAIFTIIGLIVWAIRDIRYFALFNGIGTTELVTRILVINKPKRRQLMRRLVQIIVGAILLIMLGFVFGVNFQFEQIFFDFQAGVVTGALIQLIIARLIIPFVFGNAFCSRACWDGALFEMTAPKKRSQNVVKRKWWLAWGYLLLLVAVAVVVANYFTNPAGDENELLRKKWIVGQNLFIVGGGYLLTLACGSRAYCRLLCPFMTISSLLYRFSIFKITPVKSGNCTQCGACSKACPMLIDVKESVKNVEKVQNAQCILCELCVSACPHNVLKVSAKKAY